MFFWFFVSYLFFLIATFIINGQLRSTLKKNQGKLPITKASIVSNIFMFLGFLPIFMLLLFYIYSEPMSKLQKEYQTLLNFEPEKNLAIQESVCVKGFSPEVYEIGRENFGKDGYCYGIVAFEINSFLKKNQPLKLDLNDKEEEALYPPRLPWAFDEIVNKPNQSKNYSWKDSQNIDLIQIKFDKLTTKNKSLVEKITKAHSIQPFKGMAIYNIPKDNLRIYISHITDVIIYNHVIPKTKVDTKWIFDRLRGGKPVLLAVANETTAHALLCYKAEQYDNGMVKLFVSDPNIVYERYPDKNIAELTYVLLGNNENGPFFIYNPCINENYPYRSKYCSAMPYSYIKWN